MAETMLVAFGRFLRLLRERRGLSLDQVEALTSAYPEPVSKVYLSRIENGHSKIAFSRMIAICRAYEYPIDAASERLWLDLGVDRMEDPPDTAGKGAKELLREGREYLRRGFRWHAYACARDAIAVAKTTPVSESFRDEEEQFAICLMNTATGAAKLGRFRFALTEYQYLERESAFQPQYKPLIPMHTANALLGLRRLDEATVYGDYAIAAASEADRDEYLGECLTTRASIAYSHGDHDQALALYQSALGRYQQAENKPETANVLVNLAQVSFDTGRTGAARRYLAAANRIAAPLELRGIRVRILILSGEIHEACREQEAAERCWSEGQRLAARLGDSTLLFKVKYCLYRHAVRLERPAIARKLGRALERLAPWIPLDTDELVGFRESRDRRGPHEPHSEFSGHNDATTGPTTRDAALD